MEYSVIKFRPKATPSHTRGMVRQHIACVLVGLLLPVGVGHAQQTTYKASQFSNVEVRHVPGASVWPKTTRAANGTGRIPPSIVRDQNGVKAILNPSWFTKSKAVVSSSGKVSVICEDSPKPHSHSSKAAPPKPKGRVAATRKGVRSPR